MTYGLCSTILKLGYAANPSMHHSFGDSKSNELPHITGPFWSSIDRLVITGSNETPPPLKEIFPENIDNRKHRKKGKNGNRGYDCNDEDQIDDNEVELDSIYSFSFKTTKIDLGSLE